MQSHGVFVCSSPNCGLKFNKQGDYFEHVRSEHSRLDRLHQRLESTSVFLVWGMCLFCQVYIDHEEVYIKGFS